MSFEDFITQGNQEPEVTESEYKELIQHFFNDKKDVELKTELTDAEIKEINRLEFLSDVLNYKGLETYCVRFMKLRISLKRASRKEFISSIKPDTNLLPIQQLQSPIVDNEVSKKRNGLFGRR